MAAKKRPSSRKGGSQRDSQRDSRGGQSTALTPEELKSLDTLIRDMEKDKQAQAVGIFPGVIVGFVVRVAVRWLVERAFLYIIMRKLLGGVAAGRELTESQMREAERLLAENPSPTLEDLKEVRRMLKTGKFR